MGKKNGNEMVLDSFGELKDVKELDALGLIDAHGRHTHRLETLLVILKEASLSDEGLENVEDFIFSYMCEMHDAFNAMQITGKELVERLGQAQA